MYYPDDGEEREKNLILRAIDYLEKYFESERGYETNREWSDLEYEIMDIVLDLKKYIGEDK